MFTYKKYTIKDSDSFIAAHYAGMEENLAQMSLMLAKLPSNHRKEMVLSFLKNHSMKTAWVEANPGLAEMITSKELPLGDLEALFESSRNNPSFRHDLEMHVGHQLSQSTICY
jgi:hypothetical protein